MAGPLATLLGAATYAFPYGGDTYSRTGSTATSASFELRNNGDVYATDGGAASDVGDWIRPKDSFGDYEAKAELTGDTLASGTLSSWLGLGTTRTWTLTASVSPSMKTSTLTFLIRKAVTLEEVDSFTVVLQAERT